jgi:tetratricopeptide (TPR) repeat protein
MSERRRRCVHLALLAVLVSGCAGTAPQRLARADRAFASGDYGQAVRLYAEARKAGPIGEEALVRLGRAWLELGDRVRSAAALSSALELNAECGECYALLGLLAIEDRELGRAETLLRNALRLEPADVGARNNLGYVFLLRRRPDRAYESYLQAHAYVPDDPVANVNLARLCRDYFRDVACARRHFERYLRVLPGGSEAMEIRAWLQELDDRVFSDPQSGSGSLRPASGGPGPGAPAGEAPPTVFEDPDFYLEMAQQWERKASSALELEVALRYARRAAELKPSQAAEATLQRILQRIAGSAEPPAGQPEPAAP